jgi:hypothetical protein
VVQVIVFLAVHLDVVLHQPLGAEDVDLSADLGESVGKQLILKSILGAVLDVLRLLGLLVIGLGLLFGCLVPISFLVLAVDLDVLDFFRSHTLMRYDETWVRNGLHFVSGFLLEINGQFTEGKKHGFDDSKGLGTVDGDLPGLRQDAHVPLIEGLAGVRVSDIGQEVVYIIQVAIPSGIDLLFSALKLWRSQQNVFEQFIQLILDTL